MHPDNRGSRCEQAAVIDGAASTPDQLRFHEVHGSLVAISRQGRTAERLRPLEDFNNGVVLTHRPLRDDELMELRIDRMVDKWCGSIEVGITTHSPDTLSMPTTMTNLRTGTIMMSGSGILINGKGTRREYGTFNLDQLKEGDRIAMMRKSDDTFHFYINGQDQGVAATDVWKTVWAVVDLYGMTVQVSLVEQTWGRCGSQLAEPDNSAGLGTLHTMASELPLAVSESTDFGSDSSCCPPAAAPVVEQLLFHTCCGAHAAVINGGRTAHRPNATEDFNDGVVLTSRVLRPGELFEVRLDQVVAKWAGSIELGVTTHSPTQLQFPTTMTNVRSGTWMMTGNGVMHNGTAIMDDYGINLDRLKVDDRVGVLVSDTGQLHFYVNGVDQGAAMSGVARRVYGVVDLYGQAAQVTMVERDAAPSDSSSPTSTNVCRSDLKFHALHGRNARLSAGGLTASRPNAHGEFNESVIMSNRPLRDAEVFEVVIERMVDRWSGSIEVGVTLVPPEQINFPRTMTDMDFDTWMLSGSSVMKDGKAVNSQYRCDLDSLGVGARIGMARLPDSTLHFYINGEDQGVACDHVASDVYAVIDLYGQCAQVSLLSQITRPCQQQQLPVTSQDNNSVVCSDSQMLESSQALSILLGNEAVFHRFSSLCSKSVTLFNNNTIAQRSSTGFDSAVLMSAAPLNTGEMFEVQVERVSTCLAGSLRIGVTRLSPCTLAQMPTGINRIQHQTWWLQGSTVWRCGDVPLKQHYSPSLERLRKGDRVGLRRNSDATIRISINGQEMGVAACSVPKRVWAVVELYGRVQGVSTVSSGLTHAGVSPGDLSLALADTPASCIDEAAETPAKLRLADGGGHADGEDKLLSTADFPMHCFHASHGRNVALSDKGRVARRVASYNQGLLLSARPLLLNQLFEVRIDKLMSGWSASLAVGVSCCVVDDALTTPMSLPVSALALRRSCWCIVGHSVFHDGIKVVSRYGPNLDTLPAGCRVGVLVDAEERLHMFIDGVDQGVAACGVPVGSHALLDLYGKCIQVSLCSSDEPTPAAGTSAAGDDSVDHLFLVGGCCDSQLVDSTHQPGQLINASLCCLSAADTLTCSYQRACVRIKQLLALPDEFFAPSHLFECLCAVCMRAASGATASIDGSTGDSIHRRSGCPAQDYWLSVGWCRLPIASSLRQLQPTTAGPSAAAAAGSVSVQQQLGWHTAFRSLPLSAVRATLDRRQPLLSCEHGLQSVSVCASKDESSSGCEQLFFSPALKNVCQPSLSPAFRYRDSVLGRVAVCQAAVELLVRPGSYTAAPTSLDPHRCSTKERRATVLTALLLRIEAAAT